MREQIASAISTASSQASAEAVAYALITRFRDDRDLGNALFIPMAMADMAGQLMVRSSDSGRIALADKPESMAFLDKPWLEALDEYRERGIVTQDELQRMLRTYAQRSTEARELMLRRLQKFVRDKLANAIAEGKTIKQWADDLASGDESLGITLDDPAYLQTVFRTNVQSAYGAGRFRALTDPDVIALRPYVQYRTAGDAFVRPSHALLDGRIYRAEDSTWHAIAPPNGFNCRCTFSSLNEDAYREERRDGGHGVSRTIPKGGEPDPGFDGPPVRIVERPIA